MQVEKIASHHLEKCYAITSIEVEGKLHIVVAAEKVNRCLLFTTEGELVDTIWEEPGGTMTLVPLPDNSERFLASQRMYSPNDSKEAELVLVTRLGAGQWKIEPYLDLPFVHRFEILNANGINYLVAATIKGGHNHHDDWSIPGKIYAGALDNSFSPPHLESVLEGVTRNHGFFKASNQDGEYVVISGDQGVFNVFPPNKKSSEWKSEKLLDKPVSDIYFIDLDGDGIDEMITLAPFHGDELAIYKNNGGSYELVYTHPEKIGFAHALWGGVVHGKKVLFFGHRKGESRDLYLITYKEGEYNFTVVDKDVGPTNLLGYQHSGEFYLVSANREIDEVAFYKIEA